MDATKVLELEKLMAKESLPDALAFMIKVGDIPYKANRRAVVELDLNENPHRGLKKVQETIDGIDGWVGEMELFKDAVERISKQAVSALRSS
jgi:hypothetical protein